MHTLRRPVIMYKVARDCMQVTTMGLGRAISVLWCSVNSWEFGVHLMGLTVHAVADNGPCIEESNLATITNSETPGSEASGHKIISY